MATINEKMTALADAIRSKTNRTDTLSIDEMTVAVQGIEIGSGGSINLQNKIITSNGVYTADSNYDGLGTVTVNVEGESLPSASKSDVNFYDYNGVILYSYTVAEAQTLTELPPLPSHAGLICQGWNYDLATIKSYNRSVNVGAMYITEDWKTRLYIKLEEGRTSPILGVCPKGTVTVDWGDGTAPDTLTGTSTSAVQWTPTHNYANAGEYVISLTVNGSMGFYGTSDILECTGVLRYSSSGDDRNAAYRNALQRIEVGSGITGIGQYAFNSCYSLVSITIPKSVTSMGQYAFNSCYSLASIIIPNSVTSIGEAAFVECCSLASIIIPNSVTSIRGNIFVECYSLASIIIPNSVASINQYICNGLDSLTSITIPESVTSIAAGAFKGCGSLAKVILNGTTPPTLSNSNAFNGIPDDCIFYVPAGSLGAYQTATNWSTYADRMQAY